jgi:hypothetical protein
VGAVTCTSGRWVTARHGTPVIVGAHGRADPRINLFFRTGPMAGASPATWRRYAYALVVWLEFLADEYRNRLLKRKLTDRHPGLWEDDQP